MAALQNGGSPAQVESGPGLSHLFCACAWHLPHRTQGHKAWLRYPGAPKLDWGGVNLQGHDRPIISRAAAWYAKLQAVGDGLAAAARGFKSGDGPSATVSCEG